MKPLLAHEYLLPFQLPFVDAAAHSCARSRRFLDLGSAPLSVALQNLKVDTVEIRYYDGFCIPVNGGRQGPCFSCHLNYLHRTDRDNSRFSSHRKSHTCRLRSSNEEPEVEIQVLKCALYATALAACSASPGSRRCPQISRYP